jgi:hypothetical protein
MNFNPNSKEVIVKMNYNTENTDETFCYFNPGIVCASCPPCWTVRNIKNKCIKTTYPLYLNLVKLIETYGCEASDINSLISFGINVDKIKLNKDLEQNIIDMNKELYNMTKDNAEYYRQKRIEKEENNNKIIKKDSTNEKIDTTCEEDSESKFKKRCEILREAGIERDRRINIIREKRHDLERKQNNIKKESFRNGVMIHIDCSKTPENYDYDYYYISLDIILESYPEQYEVYHVGKNKITKTNKTMKDINKYIEQYGYESNNIDKLSDFGFNVTNIKNSDELEQVIEDMVTRLSNNTEI